MKVSISRWSWLRGTVVSAAGLSAASPIGAPAQSATVRIGSTNLEANASVYYAADMGFFDRVRLPVDVQVLQNGAAAAAAIAGGSIDIATSSTFTFMNALRHGLPYTMIAPGAIYESVAPSAALVVLPSAPIQTAKDLNGKTIAALIVGALDELSIRAWMDQNGGDHTSVKLVEVPSSAMLGALEQGRVVAASVQEPHLTAAGNRLRAIGKNYDAIAKTFMVAGWFSTKSWAAKDAEQVRRFSEAVTQASAWAVANPEKAAGILEKWTKIRVPRITTRNAARLDVALVQPVCDTAWKYKMIDAPLDAKDFFWSGRST